MLELSKWTFKDLDAINDTYVRISFLNGQEDAEGLLQTMYGTLFMVKQLSMNYIWDCQYDIRDVKDIEELEQEIILIHENMKR